MNIKIQKLTLALAEDYARFFDATYHWGSDETKCYCITWCCDNVYNNGGAHWYASADERRLHGIQRVLDGDIQGYLAYLDGEIVGWCNANTKADLQACVEYLRTHGGVPMEACRPDEKVKLISCFTVAPKVLRMGVATQLLEYVCQDAAADGFDFVEAFPNKKLDDATKDHRGPLLMYEKCGFTKHAEKDGKVVMRKVLSCRVQP
ncbi:MAG: GNAT family N-acetyltransferase [Defluviitaleaceae bacterium]|nr:GNAT family N-acetyltransferase [Defluviitaleaceae bacterium]